jgi:hypothetical protein
MPGDVSQEREKLLSNRYNLSKGSLVPEEIQKAVGKEVRSGINTPLSRRSTDDEDVERANNVMIAQVFGDGRINLAQKEKIARSILEGEYRVGEAMRRADGTRAGRVAAVHDLDVARGEGLLQRHKMKKPRFIEVDGTQVPVIVADPWTILAHEQKKRRDEIKGGEKKTGFFLFNQYIPEEKVPIRPGPSEKSMASSKSQAEFLQRKTRLLQASKLNEVKKAKNSVSEMVVAAAEVKRKFSEKTHDKKQLRKRIEQFRSKILARLKEKNHPLTGRIMRSLTDKEAEAIMERFRGFTMSVDAIIALVGTSLGASGAEAVIQISDAVQHEAHSPPPPPSRGGGTVTPGGDGALAALPFSSDYPLNGRSFGSRAASRPRPATATLIILDEGGGRGEDRNDGGEERESSPNRGKGRGWNANTPSLKRLGSGFNVYASGLDPLTGRERASSLSPPRSPPQQQGEDDGRRSRGHPAKEEPNFSDSIISTEKAINVLIQEMKAQGTLPSMQPEKVISDRQIERLASHEATFDSIAREVKWQRQKKLQREKEKEETSFVTSLPLIPPSPSNLQPKSLSDSQHVEEASFGALDLDVELGFQPRPTSAGDFKVTVTAISATSRRTPPHEIERITHPSEARIPRQLKTTPVAIGIPVAPYLSWDEKQKVAAMGIPAGVGMPLWSGSRRGRALPTNRLKTPEGRVRSGTGTNNEQHKVLQKLN